MKLPPGVRNQKGGVYKQIDEDLIKLGLILGGNMPSGLGAVLSHKYEVSREFIRQRIQRLHYIPATKHELAKEFMCQRKKCGKLFKKDTTTGLTKKYCSLECKRLDYEDMYWIKRNCVVCGKEFMKRKTELNSGYCSKSCRGKTIGKLVQKGRMATRKFFDEIYAPSLGETPGNYLSIHEEWKQKNVCLVCARQKRPVNVHTFPVAGGNIHILFLK